MELFNLAKWNAAYDLTVDQIVIDSRRIRSKSALFIALAGARTDGARFVNDAFARGAIAAIVPKKAQIDDARCIRVCNPLVALQQIACCYRKEQKAFVVLIAGTAGKTMTKDLLFEMASQSIPCAQSPESFNSQIGVPLSLLTIKKHDHIAFIEAAFTKPGEAKRLAMTALPDAAIITTADGKQLPPEMKQLLSTVKGWVLCPPHKKRAFLSGKTLTLHFDDGSTISKQINSGFFYTEALYNIALEAAYKLGLKNIQEACLRYTPEAIRTEIWRSQSGVTVINEPYASDPQSIDRALQWFLEQSGKKYFLFGGLRGLLVKEDMKRLAASIKEANLDALYLQDSPSNRYLQKELKCKLYTQEAALRQIASKTEPATLLIKGCRRTPFETIAKAFTGSVLQTISEINLAAIEENLRRLQSHAKRRYMIMVKALAYGTDDVRIAHFLASCGIDLLGVSYVDEAVALRKAGVKQDLFVLHAPPYEAKKVASWGFEVGVSCRHQIEAIASAGGTCKVHLHIDTGMGRLGCRIEEVADLTLQIMKSPLILEGAMTHFSCADDPAEDPFTLTQAERFRQALKIMKDLGASPRYTHACNSAALIRFGFPEFTMARIGLALFGLQASEACRKALRLMPALTLTSRITGINHLKKGDPVSYGRKHIAANDCRIAVIPVGYFDGISRNYSNKAHVLVKGKKARIIGAICMDYLMVDITSIDCDIGDCVLLFGKDEEGYTLSPEDFALSGDSIAHELISGLGPRIGRLFIHEESTA